jgi:hypothetical protein
MSEKVKIIIAAHKSYRMPEDPMYLPLHVGAACHEQDPGYTRDDTGENISALNPSFCELTGLYWAWKNLDAEFIGLAHYRRHFSLKKKGQDPFDNVLSSGELLPLLEDAKVIVPNKRRYYIETLYSHYAHTHYADQLDQTREIISERCPDYLESYDAVVNRTWGYMFNMMILRRDLLDAYCQWLFDILFALRERMEGVELDAFQARFYGRVSEIIFNVWLDHQLETGVIAPEELREVPCIHMEPVNWWKKGTAFLKAKFMNQKYDASF